MRNAAFKIPRKVHFQSRYTLLYKYGDSQGKWSLDRKTEKGGLSTPLVLLEPSLSRLLKCKKEILTIYFFCTSCPSLLHTDITHAQVSRVK